MASSSSTFGSQWPRGNGNIATLVRRDGLRIPLHRELIPLVSMLMDLTEAMGYDLVPGWCWGYANRPISGTRSPSNHSRGCAVDINAPVNPYASASWHRRNATSHPFGLPRRTNIPQAVFELWEGHGFALGVRYGSKPDPMHFEFVKSLSECRAITARLQAHLKHPDSALPTKDDDMTPDQDKRLTRIEADAERAARVAEGNHNDINLVNKTLGRVIDKLDALIAKG